ncbi:MAG: DUF177 domain-containing protein [Clostridia bacterium]|nr:DUF177 domain-containing protein [Clostridia bacterium]
MLEINLEPLFNGADETIDINHTLDLSDVEISDTKPFSTPAVIKGVIRNDTGIVSMNALITVLYSGNCDRCAKEVTREYSILMEHTFVTELNDNQNDEFMLVPTMRFDLEGLATEDVLLYLPSKFLCKEDCKGICPTCGKDLNDGPCGCKKEIDPRLAGLAALLEDD